MCFESSELIAGFRFKSTLWLFFPDERLRRQRVPIVMCTQP